MSVNNTIRVSDEYTHGVKLMGVSSTGENITAVVTFSYLVTKLCHNRGNGLANNTGDLINYFSTINSRYNQLSDKTRFVFCDINSVLVILVAIYGPFISWFPDSICNTLDELIYSRCFLASDSVRRVYTRMSAEDIAKYERMLLTLDDLGFIPDNSYRKHGRLEIVMDKLFVEKPLFIDYQPLSPIITTDNFNNEKVVVFKCCNNICNNCDFCLSNGDPDTNGSVIYKRVSVNGCIYEFAGAIMKHYNELPLIHCYAVALVSNGVDLDEESYLLLDETHAVKIALDKPILLHSSFGGASHKCTDDSCDSRFTVMSGKKVVEGLLGQMAYAFYRKI